MNQLERYFVRVILLLMVLLPTGCSTIDDDRSDCPPVLPPDPPEPPGPDNNYELDYELQLVTNMTTELQTELLTELQSEITTTAYASVASALRNHLSTIFTDFAHDVDLSFYDTQGDSIRLQHDQHVMDANQASYTLNLPKRHYMHLAAANIVDNPFVALANDTYCHQSQLLQAEADTISSHTTGLFTARLPMNVLEGVDQSFDVHLYMANCAASLVVDTIGSGIHDIKVFVTGFATGFNIADSTYLFGDKQPIVRTAKIDAQEDGCMTFCSVTFPSPEEPLTRTIIETDEPFISPTVDGSLWELHVYIMTADGSITENKLYVNKPLRAGQLKVIKSKVHADGSIGTDDKTVAVSVKLDWSEGGGHDIEL